MLRMFAANHPVGEPMVEFQYEVSGNVVAFAARRVVAKSMVCVPCLTPRDRMELTELREAARSAGYDRMVIHDRDEGDDDEVGNFLSVYKRGDAWSRWGFARRGESIRAWCCLTGRDIGEYGSLREALVAVLHDLPVTPSAATAVIPIEAVRRSATITDLRTYVSAARMATVVSTAMGVGTALGSGMGSAA